MEGEVEIGERAPINKEGMDSVVRATTNLERWSVRVYIQTSDQWENPIVLTSALITGYGRDNYMLRYSA